MEIKAWTLLPANQPHMSPLQYVYKKNQSRATFLRASITKYCLQMKQKLLWRQEWTSVPELSIDVWWYHEGVLTEVSPQNMQFIVMLPVRSDIWSCFIITSMDQVRSCRSTESQNLPKLSASCRKKTLSLQIWVRYHRDVFLEMISSWMTFDNASWRCWLQYVSVKKCWIKFKSFPNLSKTSLISGAFVCFEKDLTSN